MAAAVAPPRPLGRERPEQRAQRGVGVGGVGLVAMGGAVLADELAGPALANAEALLQVQDRSAPAGWAQKFSLRQLLERLLAQRLIGHNALELGVLALELFAALGVVCLHPAVLVAPAVIRRLRPPRPWRPRRSTCPPRASGRLRAACG